MSDKPVSIIDEKTGHSVSVSFSQYAIKDEDGHNFTLNDAANELASIQNRADKLRQDGEDVSKLMVQIAGKCGKPEVFRALCSLVEEEHKWGRAPKGTPKEQANLWQGSPKIWQVYKSSIINAMESGLMPGGKAKVTFKGRGKDAEDTVKEVTLNTVRLLDKARREKAEQEATTKQGTAPKAGVMVNKDGTTHEHAAEQTQPMPDTELGVMLAEIAGLYDTCSESMQSKAKERLRRLVKDMEADQPENTQAAKAASA